MLFWLALMAADVPQTAGSNALALAAIIAPYDTKLPALHMAKLQGLLNHQPVKTSKKDRIRVQIDEIACHGSNVDIATFDCEIKSAGKSRKVSGRLGHELIATLNEAGVEADAGVGSLYWRVKSLTCDVRPAEIQDRAGGGASCTFTKDL